MQPRPIAVTIFGILNIAYGLLSLAMSLAPSSSTDLSSFAGNNQFVASAAACMDLLHKDTLYILWTKISAPADFLSNLALIASGVGLLLCQKWGRIVAFGYSVYAILFPLLNLVVLAHAIGGLLADDFRKYGALLMVFLALVGLFALALTLLYPLLLIYFLTRPKNRAAFLPASPPLSGN